MDLMSERMRCPYNENHLVDPLRMPYHLMKCRKKFPHIQLAVCPYSALHEVPPPELQYHMANCPDKRLVEGVDPPHALLHALSGKEPDMLKGCTDIPPAVNVNFEDDDMENWDDDVGGDTNQEHSSFIHHRRRFHHSDEANNLCPSRNTLPADFQVRRPISQSVAERLKPGASCDPSPLDFIGETQDCLGSSNLNIDAVIENVIITQDDDLPMCNPETTTNSELDSSQDDSSIGTSKCITPEKDGIVNKPNHKHILQGRGRSSLLACLDDCSSSRVERRPGFKPQVYPMMGRGRFLCKIQANQ